MKLWLALVIRAESPAEGRVHSGRRAAPSSRPTEIPSSPSRASTPS